MKSLAALILVALTLGCTTPLPNNTLSGAAVTAGDMVSVEYTGRFVNGTIFDTSAGKAPLEFTVGAGQMIKGFDSAVIGMRIDEKKTVTLAPEDAYGQWDPRNTIEVPIGNVPNGTRVGDTLFSGTQRVKVIEIRNDTIVIDFNHFLAGETLVFEVYPYR